MTDTSSKGVLPQLTDVLYLLTESQELLLSKIQGLRQAHTDIGHLAVEDMALGTSHVTPTNERVEESEVDEDQVGPRVAPVSRSEPTSRVLLVPVIFPPTDAPTSSPTLGGMTAQTTALNEAVAPASDSTASESRSYNFFDDLDERLAHLQAPEAGR